MGFRLLDHTADVGVKVWASTSRELFEEAARAMFSLITDLQKVRPTEERRVRVEGESREERLVGWLSELLFLHEMEGLLFCQFEVKEGERGVKGMARGEFFDPHRHPVERVIKAVTYHQLEVKRADGLWSVQIIFDI